MLLAVFGTASPGAPPTTSRRFPSDLMVFDGFGDFGCFCLLVLVVLGKAPLGHSLAFLLISIRFGGVVGGFGCFV